MNKGFDIDRESRRSQSIKKELESQKTEGGTFTPKTLDNIGRLGSKGHIDRIIGPIATGKEADVFLGEKNGEKIVIKIYRLSSVSYFKKPSIMQYIMGDDRFTNVKKGGDNLIYLWAMKEFKNLKTASSLGLLCPQPIAIYKNVLVMSFIGDDHPAPRLHKNPAIDPKKTFLEIVSQIKRLYAGGLVHSDISEYNILLKGESPYLIDFGQAVPIKHPRANEFLKRDVENICYYFQKRGIDCDAVDTLNKIKNGRVLKDT